MSVNDWLSGSLSSVLGLWELGGQEETGGDNDPQERTGWNKQNYIIRQTNGRYRASKTHTEGRPVLFLRASPSGEFSSLLNFSWHVDMYDILPTR